MKQATTIAGSGKEGLADGPMSFIWKEKIQKNTFCGSKIFVFLQTQEPIIRATTFA